MRRRRIPWNSTSSCLRRGRPGRQGVLVPPKKPVGDLLLGRPGEGVLLFTSPSEALSAQVAEVSLSTEGNIRVHKVVCAVDCDQVVNPDTVVGMEGGIVFGLSAALYGAITLKETEGRAEQDSRFCWYHERHAERRRIYCSSDEK